MNGFGISGHGWSAAVLADSAAALETLDRYVAPWLPRMSPDAGSADVVFEVRRSGTGFSLLQQGARVADSMTAEDLVHPIEGCIDEALVRRAPGLIAVHAGAVARGEAAVILPASTHGGKSTLVRELLRQGCTYFSDEYAMIDTQGKLHAYPRAMMLRDGGELARPMLASELDAPTGRGPVRIALILAARYERESGWDVCAASGSQMLLALLKHTPRYVSSGVIGPLAAACRSALCLTGVRGEAGDAARRIIELMAC
jgi:hypothetical protein